MACHLPPPPRVRVPPRHCAKGGRRGRRTALHHTGKLLYIAPPSRMMACKAPPICPLVTAGSCWPGPGPQPPRSPPPHSTHAPTRHLPIRRPSSHSPCAQTSSSPAPPPLSPPHLRRSPAPPLKRLLACLRPRLAHTHRELHPPRPLASPPRPPLRLHFKRRYVRPQQRVALPRWRKWCWDLAHNVWFNHGLTAAVSACMAVAVAAMVVWHLQLAACAMYVHATHICLCVCAGLRVCVRVPAFWH